MTDFFPKALALTLGEEGGFSNHKADKGGATLWGVTQKTYSIWLASGHEPDADVRTMSRDEAESIYRTLYWSPSHADEIPDEALACMQFDAAVNHGPVAAIRLLQRALDVEDDGHWGQQTLNAVINCDPVEALEAYFVVRGAFYDAIVAANPGQGVFIVGWRNRLDHLRAALQV